MFSRVKVPKAADVIVAAIKRKIVDGTLRPGMKLPSERELVEQFGISRTSIREALNTLELMGLIQIRSGMGGGATVCDNPSRLVDDSLALLLELEMTDLGEVQQTRLAIEPYSAGMAALNRDDRDLGALRQILKGMGAAADQPAVFNSLNTEFHVKLAEASHNKLLSILVSSLGGLIFKMVQEVLTLHPDSYRLALAAHTAVLDAVERRDPAQAAAELERHLRQGVELLYPKDGIFSVNSSAPSRSPIM